MNIVIPKELFEDDAPRGLARLDAAGLAELAEILADVIDDGAVWLDDVHRPWQFYPTDRHWREETTGTNADRLDFIAAVRRRIIAAPATTATANDAHDPDHLNPAKGGNQAGDDYW